MNHQVEKVGLIWVCLNKFWLYHPNGQILGWDDFLDKNPLELGVQHWFRAHMIHPIGGCLPLEVKQALVIFWMSFGDVAPTFNDGIYGEVPFFFGNGNGVPYQELVELVFRTSWLIMCKGWVNLVLRERERESDSLKGLNSFLVEEYAHGGVLSW